MSAPVISDAFRLAADIEAQTPITVGAATPYTAAETLPLLFPDVEGSAERTKFYLMAHGIREIAAGQWVFVAGQDVEEAMSLQEALAIIRQSDEYYVQRNDPLANSLLWRKAARYHWLCEFGESRDGAPMDEIEAWAKDRLPK